MIWIYGYKIEQQLSENKFNALCQHFPNTTRLKILKYRRWQDRHSALFGRLLLKMALLEQGYPQMCLTYLKFDNYDRPFIDSQIDFNISHSGNYVLCAVTKIGRIGIDIEQIRAINIDDFKNFFSHNEWYDMIHAEDSIRRFYHYWTLKESVMKADGRGLNILPHSIISHLDYAVINNKKWGLKKIDIDTSHYSCHLAIEKYDIFDSYFIKQNIVHHNLDGTMYPIRIIEIKNHA